MIEKTAVSAAIYNQSRDKVVGILRPNEQSDRLANLWGLPAISLGNDETDVQGVERIGWQKLGTKTIPVKLLGEKTRQVSQSEILTMHLWEATIKLPPDFTKRDLNDKTISKYVKWKWADLYQFIPAASMNSLCTQLILELEGIDYAA